MLTCRGDLWLCRYAMKIRTAAIVTALGLLTAGGVEFALSQMGTAPPNGGTPSIERIDERQRSDTERLTRAIDRQREHEALAGHPVMLERVEAMQADIQEIKALLVAIVQGAWVLGVSVFLLVLERGIAMYQSRRRS